MIANKLFPELELLKSSDFVGLAHPSSIEIGTGHGVYVMEQTDTLQGDNNYPFWSRRRVYSAYD